MPLMQTLISQAGPLPITDKFKAEGDGDVIFYIAGSAWASLSGSPMSIQLTLDGVVVGTAQVYTNESNSHKAFVPVFIPFTLKDINHEVTLSVTSANTYTDTNDYFQVMLIY
jgi:hypothetical protein